MVLAAASSGYLKWVRKRRREFLDGYQLPNPVIDRFSLKYPDLTRDQKAVVLKGLQQYFQICLRARGKFTSMPSQVVDDLWHDFILFTRNYENFCTKAFGCYLHHTPVEAMSSPTKATAGIRRTWFHACRIEGIDPKQPLRLPLLFALDAQLGVTKGFVYTLNCENTATSSTNTFCASGIGCGGSGCGGGAGGDGCGSSGCGGGCGGGD